jgi:hypothetical protein
MWKRSFDQFATVGVAAVEVAGAAVEARGLALGAAAGDELG